MKLSFHIDDAAITAPPSVHIDVDELVIAGWTGRDRAMVEHHVEELALLGVKRPSTIPLFYRVAANQLTQSGVIQVVGTQTSGEVEPFVFTCAGELYVSIASDHTDRELEAQSIALSKQICAKPIATCAWRFSEVEAHWDELKLRSWITENGQRTLYQDGNLSQMRTVMDLLVRYGAGQTGFTDGVAMSCGTVPAIGGIRPSTRFEMELVDERLGRKLTHSYDVQSIPSIS